MAIVKRLEKGSPLTFSELDNNFTELDNFIDSPIILDSWTQKTSGATARYGHSAVVYQDKMYIFGGTDGGNMLATLWEYDITNDSWVGKGGGAPARVSHSAIVYQDKMYIFGGFDGSSNLNDLWEYNITNDSWAQKTSGATVRNAHSAVVYEDKMYIFGGYNSGALNTLWEYDITNDSWTEKAQGASSRYDHSGVVYNGKMYIFGGTTDGSSTMNDLWIYEFATNNWTSGTNGATARFGNSAVVYSDKMYIFGGNDGNNNLNDVWQYDIPNDTWAQKTSGATIRQQPTAIISQYKMYIFGGLNISTVYDDVWEYDVPHTKKVLSSDSVLNNSNKSGSTVTEALNNLSSGGSSEQTFIKNTNFNGENVPTNLYNTLNSGSLLITADDTPLSLLDNTNESLTCENSNITMDLNGASAGKTIKINAINSDMVINSLTPSLGGTNQSINLDNSNGSIHSYLKTSAMSISGSLISGYLYDNKYDYGTNENLDLSINSSILAGKIEVGYKNFAVLGMKLDGASIAGDDHLLLTTFAGNITGKRGLLINKNDICISGFGKLQTYGQHQTGKVLLKAFTQGGEVVRPFLMTPDALVNIKALIVGREENTNSKYVATYESIVDNVATISTETGKSLTIKLQDDVNMTVDTTFVNAVNGHDTFPIMLFHINGNASNRSFWTISLEYTWVSSKEHPLNKGVSLTSTTTTTTTTTTSSGATSKYTHMHTNTNDVTTTTELPHGGSSTYYTNTSSFFYE